VLSYADEKTAWKHLREDRQNSVTELRVLQPSPVSVKMPTTNFFSQITSNSQHLLNPLLLSKSKRKQHHSPREKSHNFQFSGRPSVIDDKMGMLCADNLC